MRTDDVKRRDIQTLAEAYLGKALLWDQRQRARFSLSGGETQGGETASEADSWRNGHWPPSSDGSDRTEGPYVRVGATSIPTATGPHGHSTCTLMDSRDRQNQRILCLVTVVSVTAGTGSQSHGHPHIR
jgi:hypothetical protein